MKWVIILAVMFSSVTNSFAKKTYTMTKSEFADQFSAVSVGRKVYCHDDSGKKVWLYVNENSILNLEMSDGNKEKLMLLTIRIFGDSISAIKYNVWMPSTKYSDFSLAKVNSIFIISENKEYQQLYFNEDSVDSRVNLLNDSLATAPKYKQYNTIRLSTENQNQPRDFYLLENACYNLIFDDGTRTEYGIVQKITSDSILISNFYSENHSEADGQTYQIIGRKIEQISEIKLLKPNGISYFTLRPADYRLEFESMSSENHGIPLWYGSGQRTGDIRLYHLFQTYKGKSGITEVDGKILWHEGN